MWLLIGLLFVGLMPSKQSLWIDEGYSIPYVAEPDLGGVLDRLAKDPGSEALMPLAMVSTWAGAKVFGRSELGLRAVSAVWAAVAVLFMWGIGRLVGLSWLSAVIACHPFLWYYAGEARPYTMLIALGAGILYGGVRAVIPVDGRQRGTLWALAAIAPLLCGANVLGVVPVSLVSLVVGSFYLARSLRPSKWEWVGLLVSSGVIACFGLYYGWTFNRGAETVWRGIWTFRFEGTLFSVYELLGFVGFGPGRNLLRQLAVDGGLLHTLESLVRPAAVGSMTLGLLYVLILRRFISKRRMGAQIDSRAAMLAILVIIGTATTVMAISFAYGSPIWGRHLATLLPFVVFATVVAAEPPNRNGRAIPGTLTALLAIVLLASSLMVRFTPQHGRDDYRAAVRLAQSAVASGQTVWWVAAPLTASYYGLTFCSVGTAAGEPCTEYATNAEEKDLRMLPIPDLIIMSKPELFDRTCAARGFLRENRYHEKQRMMAFEVFEAP